MRTCEGHDSLVSDDVHDALGEFISWAWVKRCWNVSMESFDKVHNQSCIESSLWI